MHTWIEKQRNIIDFTLSSLSRRKGKNIALLLVYTLLVFLLASVMFFTYALKREAALTLRDAPEIVVQRMAQGRHEPIPRKYLEVLKKIKGVNSVRGRLWGYYFDSVIGANYTIMAPEDFPYAEGDITIGSGVSRARLVDQDDTIPLHTYDGTSIPFHVREVFSSESELVSSDLLLVSEADYRKLFGTSKDLFTDITLKVRNAKEISTVAEKIVMLLPDTRPITKREILRTYESIFDWRSGIMVAILTGAVLAFIIVSWDKASGLSVDEKKEIGILKAVGWEISDILLMKFWEGAVISLSSFLTGILLAYVHVFFTPAILFKPVLKGWSVLYPEFRLVPFIDPYQIATLFFLTVVPYTVATIVPSWHAAIIDPDSVMRS
ncbi:MAG TPA: FtsX-like permease family protein [Nitrospirota bacterium]|nr:FtsX-like permease family protein [Nitrospirota bacterium]